MSNHTIGLGLNSVVKVVIEMYDEGRIGTDEAREIIHACASGVGWGDGDMGEAIDYICTCRCGKCLKMIPEGEGLFPVWEVSNAVPNHYDIVDDLKLASDGLCEDCFDAVINERCKDDTAGEREKMYLKSESTYCTSTGEHRSTNNGYRWV